MRRYKQALYVLPVLALLLSANPSQAQVRGFSLSIGRGYPGYYGYGYGYPGFLPPYPGYYTPRSGLSLGIYSSPYYTYYPNYVTPSAYYYVAPRLSGRIEQYYTTTAPDAGRGGQAPGYGPPEDDAVTLGEGDVLFNVKVPPQAEVWINGDKTSRTGSQREFISNGLIPGRTYTYEIRARWTENGKEVERTRKIKVQGGERRTVDFRVGDE